NPAGTTTRWPSLTASRCCAASRPAISCAAPRDRTRDPSLRAATLVIGWLSARLPLDGRGWASPKDERRLLFRSIGDHVKRRLPAPIARLVLAGARAAWLPFAFFRAYRFSRAPPHAAFGTVFLDC